MAPASPEPQSVTTAPISRRDEQAARMRQYLVTMGIRTVCFVVAVIADGWLRWTCVVAAVVLPYVAVIIVNAVRPRAMSVMTQAPPHGLHLPSAPGPNH